MINVYLIYNMNVKLNGEKMKKEKNMIKIENQYLKVNIKMEKDGMGNFLNMIKKEIIQQKK